MKFDKLTADRVVAELSQARTVLANQRFLGLQITADQATIEALRQSMHPDVDEVIGNLCIREDKDALEERRIDEIMECFPPELRTPETRELLKSPKH